MRRITLIVLVIGVPLLGIFIFSERDTQQTQETSEISPFQAQASIDFVSDDYTYEVGERSGLPSVSAQSYLLADVGSGFVFAENNAHDIVSIASLSKLMTAVVIAENVNLAESIVVTPKMTEAYGITEGLVAGESFRAGELFPPFLVESSNDAAEVLAGFLGREKTIEVMNEKAQALLMEETKFVDPSGFDLQNVSTAYDIFHLIKYITSSVPFIWDVTKGKEISGFESSLFNTNELWDKNLFTPDTSLVGAKSGYLKESKFSGVFLFRFLTPEEEHRVVAFIVLGSGNGRSDIERLYGWLTRNFSLEPDYAF